MAGKRLTLACKGLHLLENDLGSLPDGALTVADDVVISRDDVVEPRRGHVTSTPAFGIQSMWTVRARDVSADGLVLWGADRALYVRNTSVVLPYSQLSLGSTTAWPYFAVGADTGGYLFLSTWLGVVKVYNGTTPLQRAGGPVGLDISAALTNVPTAPATGCLALPNNTQVAYRMTWVRRDSLGREVVGPPSDRCVVTNTSGGIRDVVLTISVPQDGAGASNSGWGTVSGDVFRVYRTTSTAYVAGVSDPGEEFAQVYEGSYTSGATVSFTDNVPDGQFGAGLYTNATQQGPTQENGTPPVCADLAFYRGSLFYAGTSDYSGDLTLLAVGAGKIDTTTTITIAGITYSGAAAENLAANQFLADTVSASVSDRLRNTAASLIRCINRGSSAAASPVYAMSTDAVGGIPGHIHYTYKIPTNAIGVPVTTNAPADSIRLGWNLPTTQHLSRLYYSKQLQPDAVPALNFLDIGAANVPIYRIVPTRDSLFIFKGDGLWRLSGDAPPWTLQPFDPTCIITAPQTAQMLANSVFALTQQGAVRVTDTDVQIISRPIEPVLRNLAATASSALLSCAFGIAYESMHQYRLHLPSGASDTQAKQAYVYDLLTETWTRDTRAATCGVVSANYDALFLSDGTNLYTERKTFTDADFADGAGPINCAVQWSPRFGNDPSQKSHFPSMALMFRKLNGTTATLSCSTDLVTAPSTIPVTLSDYGTPPFAPFTFRTYTPIEAARGSQLNVKWSQSVNGQGFQIQGLAVTVRQTGEEGGA